MRGQRYQIALIALGCITTALFAVFFYRELFPEYKIYQEDYIALEKFHATYSGQLSAPFQTGIKQIVFEREDKGPAKVDRCISCHVAMQIPHFSPTKIALDINGTIVRSADGTPVQIPNENYIWGKLNQKIATLKDPTLNAQLEKAGKRFQVKERFKEAEKLDELKTARVGEHFYDVEKALAMHPLIGKETRPFEFHPLEDYGCTTCHGGNGRGLTSEKAHGPVFDGEYEAESMGPRPEFTEKDAENDPPFASIFNSKPGDSLLFQTTPILPGALIQANCVQCHQENSTALQNVVHSASRMTDRKVADVNSIKRGFQDEKAALFSLLNLRTLIEQQDVSGAITTLKDRFEQLALPLQERQDADSQIKFMEKESPKNSPASRKDLLSRIEHMTTPMLGSNALLQALQQALIKERSIQTIDHFLQENQEKPDAQGSLFIKWKVIELQNALLHHLEEAQNNFKNIAADTGTVTAIASDIDWLTKNYHQGKQLYLAQACYACHRIAGMARGGVGPELTHAGNNYPWFLKQKMVWPQGDLKTSTMPNLRLDHVELENLMTFLLAQKGVPKTISDTTYKIDVKAWEEGRKLSWEEPLPASKIHNLRSSMTIFATEGCAACHRLKGYESNVGFKVEKENNVEFAALYREQEWFRSLFKEEMRGSELVNALEMHTAEIDQHLAEDVRKDSLLEEIEKKFPALIESMYANFRFAARAKDHTFEEKTKQESDPQKKKILWQQLEAWKQRVHRILMLYIQQYGFGHLIGPEPNWSGVYRSDEWLMEHFRNPASHVPKSIMPVFPFDESKFYALTYMLDQLGIRNRKAVHAVWKLTGFDPSEAYHIHCSQCHGDHRQGNGPIAEWIYPIPKNLTNPVFLLNLTKENAIQSITHGVKGTPMAPWGETPTEKPSYDGIPVLNAHQVEQLVDWLFSLAPGANTPQKTVPPKWRYRPEDILEELHREKGVLKSALFTSENEGVHVFDTAPNPLNSSEKNVYYIKKKYYSEQNIEAGKQFFLLNCAVCHGTEADGTGSRAGIMEEAKPRMLTNLDWLNMRDDLRLLRSIKYGVPGTSMTPWGDLTSALQRMQLVIYIRTLSEEKEQREKLAQALYRAFDQTIFAIENARIKQSITLEQLRNQLKENKETERQAVQMAESDQTNLPHAIKLYEEQIHLSTQLKKNEQRDHAFEELRSSIQKQKELYQAIGNALITADLAHAVLNSFVDLVLLNEGSFINKNEHLIFQEDASHTGRKEKLTNKIVEAIDANIEAAVKETQAVQGRISSHDKEAALDVLKARAAALTKVKGELLSGLEKSQQMRNDQMLINQALK